MLPTEPNDFADVPTGVVYQIDRRREVWADPQESLEMFLASLAVAGSPMGEVEVTEEAAA